MGVQVRTGGKREDAERPSAVYRRRRRGRLPGQQRPRALPQGEDHLDPVRHRAGKGAPGRREITLTSTAQGGVAEGRAQDLAC